MPDTAKSELPIYFEFFNEIGIIEQLSRAVMEARLPHGFLISHFSVLNHLIRVGDGRTPLAIANAFQMAKTSLTHTLSGLEKHGLIDMRANPKDGRSKLVFITEAGRAFRMEAIMAIGPDIMDIAKVFPPEMISELVPRLAAIRIFLDKRRDGG